MFAEVWVWVMWLAQKVVLGWAQGKRGPSVRELCRLPPPPPPGTSKKVPEIASSVALADLSPLENPNITFARALEGSSCRCFCF